MRSGWRLILIGWIGCSSMKNSIQERFKILHGIDFGFLVVAHIFWATRTIFSCQIAPLSLVIFDKRCGHLWNVANEILNCCADDTFFMCRTIHAGRFSGPCYKTDGNDAYIINWVGWNHFIKNIVPVSPWVMTHVFSPHMNAFNNGIIHCNLSPPPLKMLGKKNSFISSNIWILLRFGWVIVVLKMGKFDSSRYI